MRRDRAAEIAQRQQDARRRALAMADARMAQAKARFSLAALACLRCPRRAARGERMTPGRLQFFRAKFRVTALAAIDRIFFPLSVFSTNGVSIAAQKFGDAVEFFRKNASAT